MRPVSKFVVPAAELAVLTARHGLRSAPQSVIAPLLSNVARIPLQPMVGVRSIATKASRFKSEVKPDSEAPACKLVYDGDCPVCEFSADKVAQYKDVELINARDGGDALVKQLESEGFDLDKGMVFVDEAGKRFSGDKGVEKIIAGDGSNLARVWAARASKPFYPSLVGIRNALVGGETISEQRAREAASKTVEDGLLVSVKPGK